MVLRFYINIIFDLNSVSLLRWYKTLINLKGYSFFFLPILYIHFAHKKKLPYKKYKEIRL